MKLLSIVGTRPNLVKEYLIHKHAKDFKIDEIVLHTGQHYDFKMSKVFEEDFEINVDYNLKIGSSTHGFQTGKMLEKIEEILIKEEPDATLVYGDVNSTVAGALASVKCEIPVIHYEGGIRADFRFNPEEINRKVSDCVSSLIFCVTQSDVENLKRENFSENDYVYTGDLHKDLMEIVKKKHNIKIADENFILCTIHRAETTNKDKNLNSIIGAILESKSDFKIPLHPRTRKILEEKGLYKKLEKAQNVEILDPQSYINFVKLLSKSSAVLTDSGGVRREGFLLKKPVINFGSIIWFKDIMDAGYKIVANYNKDRILDALSNFQPDEKKYYNIFGDGNAYKKILQEISKRFS